MDVYQPEPPPPPPPPPDDPPPPPPEKPPPEEPEVEPGGDEADEVVEARLEPMVLVKPPMLLVFQLLPEYQDGDAAAPAAAAAARTAANFAFHSFSQSSASA